MNRHNWNLSTFLFSGLKRMTLLPLLFLSSALLAYTSSAVSAEAHSHAETTANDMKTSDASEGVSYQYVCPMHPQIVRPHEGTCPICGMDLVKQVFQQSEEPVEVSVTSGSAASGMTQAFSVKTTPVQKATLWRYIPTFAKLQADESQVVHIHPRASGWISDLGVKTDGDQIEKGQLLYRLYSPEIVAAQQDYLLAVRNVALRGQSKAQQRLVESAKKRLELLGVNGRILRQIRKTQKVVHDVPVYAPISGVVGDLVVQNGMYIQPQTELMMLSDLSSLWAIAEVLPLQQEWVKQGLTVELNSDAFPDRYWEGDISYLYPLVDAQNQALRVRIPIPNQKGLLRPNMIMDAAIYGGPKRNVLAIPMSAVIDDGETPRVMVQTDSGGFQAKTVQLGMQTKGLVEVLAGLKEGDKVVTSGQFMLDSESQIQTNLRKLSQQAAEQGKSLEGFQPVDAHAHH